MNERPSDNFSLRQAHDELERRVRERTSELSKANEALQREILERKRIETHLRESEQRLQAIVDNAPAVVYLKDLEGRYLLVNRIYEQLFHVTREQVIGKTDHDIFPKEAADEFRRNDRIVCDTGRAFELEEVAPHDDGLHTYISLKFPMIDGKGRVQALCGISTDITDRKRAEEGLQAAKKAAEEASLAKSRFLANMSHEIRTPITAMLGAAELLAGDPSSSPSAVEHSKMILRNGRHLLALVENLLDLSMIEAGRLRLRSEEISLIDIFSDVLALTSGIRQIRPDIAFQMEFESPVPDTVRTDRTRLTQAVVNLVQNAMKFTSRGEVVVRISSSGESSNTKLRVVVEDSGPGISQEDLNRIFEAFVQVRSVSQAAISGVGLGLSLARWIAESLGGTLTVESTVGRGSRFHLNVPCGMPPGAVLLNMEEAKRRAFLSCTPEIFESPARFGGRILIAEDAPDTRKVLSIALRSAGATVVCAEDGAEAVKLAESQPFDLILMDIRMPGMDGITALSELRKRGILSVVVALTASANASDQARIAQAGFDDIWQKPLALSELARRAAQFLPNETISPTQVASSAVDQSATGAAMQNAIRSFLHSLPDRFRQMQIAMERMDLAKMDDLLHQLIGTSGMHGFLELSQESTRLMNLIRQNQRLEFNDLADLTEIIRQVSGGGCSNGNPPHPPNAPASPPAVPL